MKLYALLVVLIALTHALVPRQEDGQPHKTLMPGPRYERLNKEDVEGVLGLVNDFDIALYKANILAHSALGQVFDIPVVITSSVQTGPNGVVLREITNMYPNVTVIVGGITTDVCTGFLALSLREEGYTVFANAEASGSISVLHREVGNQRMVSAGVQLMTLISIVTELMRSWADTPGAAEILPWMDEHVPHYAFIARAHGHAILNGEIPPGEEEIL